jgi:hypothetical protein
MNKFAVLAASLVASFALAFAVYSAENNPDYSRFPRVVASVRLTNQTQPILTTTILNVRETGLYRVSAYTAMTTRGTSSGLWTLKLNWADEAGTETSSYSVLNTAWAPPSGYGQGPVFYAIFPAPAPIEAIAGTPITFSFTGATEGDGTYELFMTVERLQ